MKRDQESGFETGRISGILKGLNCRAHSDANVSVECSRLPDGMSLPPSLLKLVVVK